MSSGSADVMKPDGSVLSSGGSATQFGLELPAGAVCPGDTYHHDYLVYSFAIPASVDLSAVDFYGTAPSKGVPLITTTGDPYVTVATAMNSGAVSTPPLFTFSRFDHDLSDFPMGLYNVGIACAVDEGHVQRYWAAQIRFSASNSDVGGFTWRVVSHQPGSSSSGVGYVIIGVIAAIGIGSAFFLGRRRPVPAPVR